MSDRMIKTSTSCFKGTATNAAQTLLAIIGGTMPTIDNGDKANSVIIKSETQSFRVRFDGSAPTSTVGTLYNAGEGFSLTNAMDLIDNMQIIRGGAVDATINIHFFESEGN